MNNINYEEKFKNVGVTEPTFLIPYPLMNIINGGAHANNNLDFQEFIILPIGFKNFNSSLYSWFRS